VIVAAFLSRPPRNKNNPPTDPGDWKFVSMTERTAHRIREVPTPPQERSARARAFSDAKTILELDLVAYSDVARMLEENLNLEAVKTFEDQIQEFIDHGLAAVGARRDAVVLRTEGDNAVLMFDDAGLMHRFAQAVQSRTLAHNLGKSVESAKRWFRMGAATGPVLVVPEERRVVGSTIPRAVRLEAVAEIGQLVVDLATFEALPDDLKALYAEREIVCGKRTERFEVRRCTMIDAGVRGAATTDLRRQKAGATKQRSAAIRPIVDSRPAIAVLPFVNLSRKSGQDYLSDGIASEIIDELASWRMFPVIARNSSFAFKGQPIGTAEIGNRLGVRCVVEGSVVRIDERLRISAQLVDAVSGLQLVSERFERRFKELPDLGDQIAAMIVGSIAPELLRIERYRVAKTANVHNTSDEHFLRGLEAHYRYTKTDNENAQRQFRRAIKVDPQNSQAHALLASAIMHAVQLGWRENADHNYMVADRLARRAVALDPRAPVAHFSLGSTSMFLGRIDEALTEMREALRINPSHAAAHAIMAPLRCYVGMPQEALESARRAITLSPYDPRLGLWLSLVSQAQYFLTEYEEAVASGQQALSLIAENPLAYRFAAASLGQLDRIGEAAELIAFIRRSSTPSIAAIRQSVSHLYRDERMIEHMLDGLRRAGLDKSHEKAPPLLAGTAVTAITHVQIAIRL
jgi:TolB-like protein/class 3 adenylate cyclase/cytochrome c-type biogenesis protein CcmH/NrfG